MQARAKERQQGGQGGTLLSQKSDEAKNGLRTDDEIAKAANVSRDTIRKAEYILQNGTAEEVERARAGGKTQ